MSSTKNTFRKIHCLDDVLGVLRYLACSDGQIKTRRNGDGIISYPHTHMLDNQLGTITASGISRLTAKHIDLNKHENCTWYHGGK